MADYRLIMRCLLDKLSYRMITARTGAAQATISKARKALQARNITTHAQINALTDDELAVLIGDGRTRATRHFIEIDMDSVIHARTGRKKTPLNVLWAEYCNQPVPEGLNLYSYERFRQLVAMEVASRGLTARITHVPGATMQVDWAGTKMRLTDPVTGKTTPVSIFVATLPYSGMVFATGRLDERQDNWHEAHRLAFEYFGGVAELIIPDNATTATTARSRGEKTRRINRAYEEFLAHYSTAALATPPASPTYKGNVEAGVKVITSWVIGALASSAFSNLDDLDTAIRARVDAINDKTPFRDNDMSRRMIFTTSESSHLAALPATPFEKVHWRKAKVAPD